MARPLRHPWAFFELWWRPWLFYGEGDAVWSILLVGIDLPIARFGLFCGSDDLIATFPCSGLFFFVVLITRLRLSLVLVYFSLNFR